MGEKEDVGSFLSIAKRRNVQYARSAGISAAENKELSSLRGADEESYKVLLLPIFVQLLTQLVLANDKLPPQKRGTVFNSSNGSTPDISIQNYLERIIKYAPASPEAYICAFIFIDRLFKTMRITSLNVHRVLLTSIMIASKLLDDCTWNNKYYSHVAGVTCKELASLECRFLSLINFELFIQPQVFEAYRYEIELQFVRVTIAHREGLLHATIASQKATEQKQEQEESKKLTMAEAREKARYISKKLRRSRSFNNDSSSSSSNSNSNSNSNSGSSSGGGIFHVFGRKRRSNSFTFSF